MLRRLAADAFELMALAAFLCSVAMLARRSGARVSGPEGEASGRSSHSFTGAFCPDLDSGPPSGQGPTWSGG